MKGGALGIRQCLAQGAGGMDHGGSFLCSFRTSPLKSLVVVLDVCNWTLCSVALCAHMETDAARPPCWGQYGNHLACHRDLELKLSVDDKKCCLCMLMPTCTCQLPN